uniref:Putative LOC100205425 [Hydra vulgaris] n=1 Tax=Lepeophtheirus salmonis TaxID=72036 RepID=A0A0K2UZL3_LEPSM
MIMLRIDGLLNKTCAKESSNGPFQIQLIQKNHFSLFDGSHIYKCIRNNWKKETIFECPDFDGKQIGSPNWIDILELYRINSVNNPRMVNRLNEKALNPTFNEKTNVKLCDIIFHDSIISGMQ